MLLIARHRRHAVRRPAHPRADRHPDRHADREAGSALATVLAILAITGIVAASLAAMTLFSTGYTSATRAGLQARAAAEGGMDYAAVRLMSPGVCVDEGAPGGPGVIRSPAGSDPQFVVEVSYLNSTTTSAGWVEGCPDRWASDVRLLSTGTAAPSPVDGLHAGYADRAETMDAAYRATEPEFVRAVVGDRDVRVARGLDVTGTTELEGDVISGGDLECGGPVTTDGLVYVAQSTAKQCDVKGVKNKVYDPKSPENAFPRITPEDARWREYHPASLKQIAQEMSPGSSNYCDVNETGNTRTLRVMANLKVDSRSSAPGAGGCPDGMSLNSTNGLKVELHADFVFFADRFTLRGPLIVSSGDGKPHTLYIVRPWSPTTTGCTHDAASDIQFLGSGITTIGDARVMVYSSSGVAFGRDPAVEPVLRDQRFTGQVYGCTVTFWDRTQITFTPATASILGDKPQPEVALVSKRDVTDPAG